MWGQATIRLEQVFGLSGLDEDRVEVGQSRHANSGWCRRRRHHIYLLFSDVQTECGALPGSDLGFHEFFYRLIIQIENHIEIRETSLILNLREQPSKLF